MSSDPASMTGGRRPLLRLIWLARPLRGQLVLSVLAGAAATGCGVALLATSGFLLARASEHPNILAISVAVVAVRAFSIGRGVSRYLERLTSHDVAFRVLADIRVAIYRRLERLARSVLRPLRDILGDQAPSAAPVRSTSEWCVTFEPTQCAYTLTPTIAVFCGRRSAARWPSRHKNLRRTNK